MIRMKKISQLDPKDLSEYGSKAIWLHKLFKNNIQTPGGIVLRIPVNSKIHPDLIHINDLRALLNFDEKTPYMVRSSAPGEDQQNSSCAGQFLSIGPCLGITEITTAIEKVYLQACQTYKSLGMTDQYFGIVVQQMITGDQSGVCFTSDWRQSGDLCLEYINGGCGDLVQGYQQPLTARFCHQDLKANRNTRESDQIRSIAKTFLDISEIFDQALDIEWTLSGNKLYLLQARPVVQSENSDSLNQVLRHESTRLKQQTKPLDLLTSQSIGEVFGQPGPLFSSLIHQFVAESEGLNQVFRRFGLRYKAQEPSFLTFCGRPWINLSAYARCLGLNIQFKLRPKPYPKASFSIRPWNLLTITKLLRAVYLIFRRKNSYIAKQTGPFASQANHKVCPDSENQSFSCEWDRATHQLFTKLIPPHLEADILSGVLDGILQKILLKILKQQGRVSDVIGSFCSGFVNPNLKYSIDLYDFAQKKITWEEFETLHGHRSESDWNIASPRYRERKPYFQHLCKSLAPIHPRLRVLRKKRRNRLLHKVCREKWWYRLLRTLLIQNGELFYLREKTQNDLYHQIDAIRSLCLKRSEQLGLPNELVFYLLPEELCLEKSKHKDLRAIAQKRQRQMRLAGSVSLQPFISPSKPEEFSGQTKPLSTTDLLSGTGVSFGTYEGQPFIVESQDDLHRMPPGSVIVAKRIDPSWAPLLLRAGAIITETGGAFCHSSLLIREMGIPAVAGITGIPEAFRFVNTLKVDGSTGIVHRLPCSVNAR